MSHLAELPRPDRAGRCCLFTPELGHTVVYGMSANRDMWWDNSKAAHLGFHAAGQLRAVPRQGRGPAACGPDRSGRASTRAAPSSTQGPFETRPDAMSMDRPNWSSMRATPSAKARSGWRASRRCTGSTSRRARLYRWQAVRRPRRALDGAGNARLHRAARRPAAGCRAWKPACSACGRRRTARWTPAAARRSPTPAPACASTTAAATARAAFAPAPC